MNLLLDTCILIDYIGRREPFFADAQQIIAAGYFGDVKLWIPGPSFKDAFYVLSRYADSSSVQRAFVNLAEAMTPVSLAPEDYIRAARLKWNDYEDCLVALAADRAHADYLITRDSKGFERSTVPTLSPRQWIRMMEADHGLAFDIVDLTAE